MSRAVAMENRTICALTEVSAVSSAYQGGKAKVCDTAHNPPRQEQKRCRSLASPFPPSSSTCDMGVPSGNRMYIIPALSKGAH